MSKRQPTPDEARELERLERKADPSRNARLAAIFAGMDEDERTHEFIALRSLLRRAADVIRDRVALIPSERDAALLTEIEAQLGPGRTT